LAQYQTFQILKEINHLKKHDNELSNVLKYSHTDVSNSKAACTPRGETSTGVQNVE